MHESVHPPHPPVAPPILGTFSLAPLFVCSEDWPIELFNIFLDALRILGTATAGLEFPPTNDPILEDTCTSVGRCMMVAKKAFP